MIYEDDMFRVAYPPNSDVAGAEGGRQDPNNPTLGIVPPPAAGNSVVGAFVLRFDKASHGMLLRDGIAAEINRDRDKRQVILGPVRETVVGNGRCLSTIVISQERYCAKDAGSCYAPVASVLCDGPNGTRYSVGTVFSVGPSPDRLSPKAQQEAVVYERILRSLEFKKS